MTDADDYAQRFPCMRSGYCCKAAPCLYGEVTSPTNRACKFLEEAGEIAPGVMRYACGKYAWIMKNVPESQWKFSPAFGAGCSSPLFNEARNVIIDATVSQRQQSKV